MAFAIVGRRTEPAPGGDHEHLALVGFYSKHTPTEAVLIPIQRVIDRMALGEEFVVAAGGETLKITEGKCPVCGHEPYLVTEKDPPGQNLLLALPYR